MYIPNGIFLILAGLGAMGFGLMIFPDYPIISALVLTSAIER